MPLLFLLAMLWPMVGHSALQANTSDKDVGRCVGYLLFRQFDAEAMAVYANASDKALAREAALETEAYLVSRAFTEEGMAAREFLRRLCIRIGAIER